MDKIKHLMKRGYDLRTAYDHVKGEPLPDKYDFVSVRYDRNQAEINRMWNDLIFPDPDLRHLTLICVKCGGKYWTKNLHHIGARTIFHDFGGSAVCDHEFEII